MPIDTEQWRAQTGFFCASRVFLRPPRCKQPKVQADMLSLNMKFSLAVLLVTLRTGIFYASRTFYLLWLIACHSYQLLSSIVRLSCKRLRGVSILLALCLVVIAMLLIMSGDVEENPGPPKIQAGGSPLGMKDLKNVLRELCSVSHKWYYVGLELDVQAGTLKNIKSQYPDPTDRLCEMLECWLKSTDPEPTWDALATALDSSTVGEERLAARLRGQYCRVQQQRVAPVEQQQQSPDVRIEIAAPRPPIYGPVPQSPAHTPVDQYASYLRSVYTSKKLPTYCKWPPTASKKYIHLAVVKKERVSKEQADEFTKATLHGNIDDICKQKKEVGFIEVGVKEDGTPAKLILVEGAPGIGKTTFAWKVCRKWAKGKILRKYGLVVLLRLRDKRVREVQSVADLFYHSDHELQKSVAKEIQYHQGKSVLLLYEGYDELPKRLQIQQSIFLDILRKVFLPQAAILITSRPSATKYLHWEFRELISQHIEILGFTTDDIISYVNHVIEDEHMQQDFFHYLKCHPYIRGMMYVPLNAVIVTEVYKTSQHSPDKFIPTTMTELYTALTRSLLLRYLLSHSEYRYQEWNLKNFSDLPKELYEQFCRICEVALKGMIEDEFVFDDLPNDFNTLDLMQSVPELYVQHGAVVSYNFFHLTLQEYLAAVQISNLPVKKQIDFFEGNSGSNGVPETDLILPISNMGESTSGRESFDMGPQMTMGMKMDTTLPKHLLESHLPTGLPHLQLSPPTIRPTPDYEMLDIAHFGKHTQSHSECYEKDLETVGNVMGNSSTPIVTTSDSVSLDHSTIHLPQPHSDHGSSTVPFHYQSPPLRPHTSLDNLHTLPPSYHIASGSLNTKLEDTDSTRFWKVLRFVAGLTKYENIPLDSLQQLLLQQNKDEVEISLNSLHWLFEARCTNIYSDLIRNVLILHYRSFRTMTPFDCFVLGYALSHISYTGDWVITMRGCYVDDECVEMLAGGINFMSSEVLKINKLDLSLNAITAGGATTLAEMLKENRTLQQLNVSHNFIGQGGATALAEMLKENRTLQQLNVSDSSIGQGGAIALAEMLKENRTLQQLNVSRNSIGQGGATALAEMLKENRTLQQLNVSHNFIGQGGATALAEMLKENRTLQQLNVSNNSIGQGGATALAEMQKENRTLQLLNVSDNSIGQGGATALVEMLKENRTLQQLNISYNSIGQGGATALAEMLKDNRTLQQLNISYNSIGQGGATALAEMLKDNRTLQQLNVSYNFIGQGGATALAEMLKENRTLQQLNVSNNSIGQGGATALAEMLKENRTLQQLNVSDNSIGQRGATALAEMLKENRTLQQLNVSDSSIGQGGAIALAEMLKENRTLQQLNIRNNFIGQGGATALAEMKKQNTVCEVIGDDY